MFSWRPCCLVDVLNMFSWCPCCSVDVTDMFSWCPAVTDICFWCPCCSVDVTDICLWWSCCSVDVKKYLLLVVMLFGRCNKYVLLVPMFVVCSVSDTRLSQTYSRGNSLGKDLSLIPPLIINVEFESSSSLSHTVHHLHLEVQI